MMLRLKQLYLHLYFIIMVDELDIYFMFYFHCVKLVELITIINFMLNLIQLNY